MIQSCLLEDVLSIKSVPLFCCGGCGGRSGCGGCGGCGGWVDALDVVDDLKTKFNTLRVLI